MRVLLIQVRATADPMAVHETRCVAARLGDHRPHIVVRSIFADAPERSWLSGIDAVVIGGSGTISVADPELAPALPALRDLLDALLEGDRPAFGICFGHQLLGYHLGAEVITDLPRRETGTIRLRLTEDGRRDPVFGRLDSEFFVHTGHTDRVTRVPNGAVLLASSEAVEVQALHIPGTRFYSTQFHPDLTAQCARDRYRAFAQARGDDDVSLAADLARFDLARRDTDDLLARAMGLNQSPSALVL